MWHLSIDLQLIYFSSDSLKGDKIGHRFEFEFTCSNNDYLLTVEINDFQEVDS